VQIKPPWEGSCVSLLKDDPRYRTSGRFYQFPGATAPYFKGSDVLNRLLEGKGRLNPEDDVEGLILATDPQNIPDDVADRGWIVVKVAVFHGAGNVFPSKFRLCVDRSAARARKRAEEVRARLAYGGGKQ
jgi:hypothetical protein